MSELLAIFLHAVEWLRAQGAWTLPLAYLIFVVSNAALVPASLLSVALGFVYGFVPGFLVAWLGRPSAGLLACFLCRTLLRERVQRWSDAHPIVSAVDRALSKGGARVILLLRLSPLISSTLVNWALGVTRVTYPAFGLGSALGVLPSTLAYAYIGSGLSKVTEITTKHDDDPIQKALFWFGLVATIACVWLVSRLAKRELERELAQSAAPSS